MRHRATANLLAHKRNRMFQEQKGELKEMGEREKDEGKRDGRKGEKRRG